MARVINTDELFKHFLKTDTNQWVLELVPYLKRLGFFKIETDSPQLSSVVVYEILITESSFSKGDRFCNIRLSCSIKGEVNYSVASFTRQVEITGDLANIGMAQWTKLDDPLVKKVYEIAQCAHPVTIPHGDRYQ
ncbi:hypothetical protein ABC383_15680 [Noviherbaspirillum sp. 1P10PC]|uniref:hypothetical protein n=1 Tax=Noviherbaspirillum sp. 1P10PC TaxID=3132292 RepID=UPI0039A32179